MTTTPFLVTRATKFYRLALHCIRNSVEVYRIIKYEKFQTINYIFSEIAYKKNSNRWYSYFLLLPIYYWMKWGRSNNFYMKFIIRLHPCYIKALLFDVLVRKSPYFYASSKGGQDKTKQKYKYIIFIVNNVKIWIEVSWDEYEPNSRLDFRQSVRL